jgi:hypothetical protein
MPCSLAARIFAAVAFCFSLQETCCGCKLRRRHCLPVRYPHGRGIWVCSSNQSKFSRCTKVDPLFTFLRQLDLLTTARMALEP